MTTQPFGLSESGSQNRQHRSPSRIVPRNRPGHLASTSFCTASSGMLDTDVAWVWHSLENTPKSHRWMTSSERRSFEKTPHLRPMSKYVVHVSLAFRS